MTPRSPRRLALNRRDADANPTTQSSRQPSDALRDRVRDLRRVPANELVPHPLNWRTHPERQQRALATVVDELGFAGAVLAYERDDGRLQLIDGHLRQSLAGDQTIPVLVLDVTPDEANKLLATWDPLSAMASADSAALRELLNQVGATGPELTALLQQIGEQEQALERLADAAPSTPWQADYRVLIDCRDEAEQLDLLARFADEGLTARALIV